MGFQNGLKNRFDFSLNTVLQILGILGPRTSFVTELCQPYDPFAFPDSIYNHCFRSVVKRVLLSLHGDQQWNVRQFQQSATKIVAPCLVSSTFVVSLSIVQFGYQLGHFLPGWFLEAEFCYLGALSISRNSAVFVHRSFVSLFLFLRKCNHAKCFKWVAWKHKLYYYFQIRLEAMQSQNMNHFWRPFLETVRDMVSKCFVSRLAHSHSSFFQASIASRCWTSQLRDGRKQKRDEITLLSAFPCPVLFFRCSTHFGCVKVIFWLQSLIDWWSQLCFKWLVDGAGLPFGHNRFPNCQSALSI